MTYLVDVNCTTYFIIEFDVNSTTYLTIEFDVNSTTYLTMEFTVSKNAVFSAKVWELIILNTNGRLINKRRDQ